MSSIKWSSTAWKEYLHWQEADKRTLRRINKLLDATMRTPYSGIGKPEPLKLQLSGYWSRRIDHEHRLVYQYDANDDTLIIVKCRYHY